MAKMGFWGSKMGPQTKKSIFWSKKSPNNTSMFRTPFWGPKWSVWRCSSECPQLLIKTEKIQNSGFGTHIEKWGFLLKRHYNLLQPSLVSTRASQWFLVSRVGTMVPWGYGGVIIICVQFFCRDAICVISRTTRTRTRTTHEPIRHRGWYLLDARENAMFQNVTSWQKMSFFAMFCDILLHGTSWTCQSEAREWWFYMKKIAKNCNFFMQNHDSLASPWHIHNITNHGLDGNHLNRTCLANTRFLMKICQKTRKIVFFWHFSSKSSVSKAYSIQWFFENLSKREISKSGLFR